MKDSDKTQTQLIKELDSARKRLSELKEGERQCGDSTETPLRARTGEEQITARKHFHYLLTACPGVVYASRPSGRRLAA